MLLMPAPGLMIRDPELHDFLPPDGREVTLSDYWYCRLRDGDVLACTVSKGGEREHSV